MNPTSRLVALILCLLSARPSLGAERVLDASMHHLRNASGREWAEFPEQAESNQLLLRFEAEPNPTEFTLRVRHRDLKQQWRITLNGRELAKLPQDEREMITFWPVPQGSLKAGQNELRVIGPAGPTDDVSVGEVSLLDLPKSRHLSESSIEVSVLDAQGKRPLPSRLTLTDPRGIPIETGNSSSNEHAVRPGVLYTATGSAVLHVPGGRYRLFASKGFEYSLAVQEFDLKPGDRAAAQLPLTREVDTAGYVATDTHVHTATYARHGDASIAERMITLAGEGVELPISAEHNLLVDFESHASAAGVRRHFTPVLGQELTTPAAGHFNLFPLPPGFKTPNVRALTDWQKIPEAIRGGGADAPLVVLNHARDVHSGFRPFDPKRHISITGESLDGSTLPANAMEVLNSGAVLSDPMLLVRDWMGLLTRGMKITPVGASDSHDVTRYIVGQGRTYVRADDADPSKIDVPNAVQSFRAGKVLVSFGLLAELEIDDKRPGDLYTPPVDATHVTVKLRVQGPSWSEARHVALFIDGQKYREADLPDPDASKPGVKFTEDWKVPLLKQDLAIVIVVTGPGIASPHWPTAKPYQPTGIEFVPYTLALTAPIFVDADRSNSYESPREFASRIVSGDPDDRELIRALADHDAATAAHVASLLREKDPSGFERRLLKLLPRISPHAAPGVRTYLDQWRLAQQLPPRGEPGPPSRGN